MKNLLLTLALSASTSLGLAPTMHNQTTTKIIDSQSFLIKTEQNINKIFWQSEGNYSYSFQIYVSHDTLNNWNSSYNQKLLFELTVSRDLVNFESNTTLGLLETHTLSNNLYQLWIKNKVISYDYNQGVIFKLQYSRYSLQSVTIISQ